MTAFLDAASTVAVLAACLLAALVLTPLLCAAIDWLADTGHVRRVNARTAVRYGDLTVGGSRSWDPAPNDEAPPKPGSSRGSVSIAPHGGTR